MRSEHGIWTLSLALALGCGGGGAGEDSGVADAARADGARDAGAASPDAAFDAAVPDATVPDATVPDATVRDASASDAGSTGPGPVLGGCPLFPADNMWNTEIVDAPLHDRSDAYIRTMGTGTTLHPDFGTVWDGAPNGIPFVLVGADQPRVPMSFLYADESDSGPYPIPMNPPIEGGPAGTGDRHILVLETGSCTLYEVFDARPEGAGWSAGSGAVWHLDRNERRPDGWTSADAAGLAILPGLVRYDEVASGEIPHALRFTVNGAQSAYIHPATHSDGRRGADLDAPPMGLRLRLRADFDVSSFSGPIQVILRAMKRFGVVVADTGSDWYISGAPDPRWDDAMLRELARVVGSDFEAVYTGDPMPY